MVSKPQDVLRSFQRDRILLYLGTHFNTIYYTSEFRFWGVFVLEMYGQFDF